MGNGYGMSAKKTFYWKLKSYHELAAMDECLLIAHRLLGRLGPEKTIVLCLVLREECLAAQKNELVGYKHFIIHPSRIAKEAGLSLAKTIRCLQELGDVSSSKGIWSPLCLFFIIDRQDDDWEIFVDRGLWKQNLEVA
jgi:hypothetical protein